VNLEALGRLVQSLGQPTAAPGDNPLTHLKAAWFAMSPVGKVIAGGLTALVVWRATVGYDRIAARSGRE